MPVKKAKAEPGFRERLAALEAEHEEALSGSGGYRCYDGCPGTELKLKWAIEDLILKEIKKHEPEACCTHFPVEEKYQVHVRGKDIGPFSYSEKDALLGALQNLESRATK